MCVLDVEWFVIAVDSCMLLCLDSVCVLLYVSVVCLVGTALDVSVIGRFVSEVRVVRIVRASQSFVRVFVVVRLRLSVSYVT